MKHKRRIFFLYSIDLFIYFIGIIKDESNTYSFRSRITQRIRCDQWYVDRYLYFYSIDLLLGMRGSAQVYIYIDMVKALQGMIEYSNVIVLRIRLI